MCATAWTIPCNTLICDLLTAISKVSVAPMYKAPDKSPPHATAPGRVFAGSWISSPIMEASSNPTSPKQMTPNEFNTKRGLAGILKSAQVTVVPNFDHMITPSPINSAAATNVPIAPMLLIHFPTPSPTTFNTTSTVSRHKHALKANARLSASPWWLSPRTNTETPTKYSSTVGTYIILFVQ